MTEHDEDWATVSYVVASGYRQTVLGALNESASTPSHLAEKTDIKIAHVSRSLRELNEKDLAELLVAEDTKKGRIYAITEKGRDALEGARQVNGDERAVEVSS